MAFWDLDVPKSFLDVGGWYSPSASYMQIVPTNQPAKCGAQTTFKIQYGIRMPLDTHLKYKVVHTDRI